MAVDPQVRRFLDTKPDAGSPDRPVAERRASILRASDELFDTFGEPAPEVHSAIEYPVGASRVRVYRPDATAVLPVHIFIHGGGFWLGSIQERVVDATCRERAVAAQCVVVAVEYRLAPEHPFPVPVEDCYQGLVWAYEHAPEFGGDPTRLSIGGVSAGANLAASVTLAARDRGGPPLIFQLLEVPVLDLTLDTMRGSGVPDDYGITVAEMELSTRLYLARREQAGDSLASPLLCTDLAALPAARVMTAEFDPLRADGLRFAERLRAAGVPAEHRNYPGAVHGSLALTGTWQPARDWRADLIAALVRAHSTAGTSTR